MTVESTALQTCLTIQEGLVIMMGPRIALKRLCSDDAALSDGIRLETFLVRLFPVSFVVCVHSAFTFSLYASTELAQIGA